MANVMNTSDTSIFLDQNIENQDLNQYWYSPKTIQKITEEIINLSGKVAFLSTPSIYFSIPEDIRHNCFLFDVWFY
jgi:hypothetical protein